jgi:hypothetical protein
LLSEGRYLSSNSDIILYTPQTIAWEHINSLERIKLKSILHSPMMPTQIPQAENITRILSGEMFKALGFSRDGLIARIFFPIVRGPIHRFAKLAVGFDQRVQGQGFQRASQWILPNFINMMDVSGEDGVPTTGPLLVVSNHPGAYDALVIAANLPRDDIKIVVNIPLDFINEIPTTLRHFLYAPLDPFIRLRVVREAIKHLRSGGALLLFASGGMDPDPASMPGARDAIDDWSRSVEIFIKKVPETRLLITMISGIIAPKYVKHVFTHFRKSRKDKQRISEFVQILYQMVKPGRLLQSPKLTFNEPLTTAPLIASGSSTEIMDSLKIIALHLLEFHIHR